MKENLEIMRQAYLRKLVRMIEAAGKKCEPSLDAILDNLDCLALEIPHFDEKRMLLPLEIKRMIAYVISPNYRMEYESIRDGDYLTVVAKLFWETEDIYPAGVGFMRANIRTYFMDKFVSTEEEKECKFEATVRGSAATRAFYDAGIGLGFGDEIPDPEQMEKDMTESEQTPMPDPKSAKNDTNTKGNKRGQKSRALQGQDASSVNLVNTPVAVAEEKTSAPACNTAVVEQTVMPEKEDQMDKSAQSTLFDKKQDVLNEPLISLEEAKKAVADMGQATGHTLGEIFEKQPKNLLWLWNKGSAMKKEIEIVIRSDPELYKMFCEKCKP